MEAIREKSTLQKIPVMFVIGSMGDGGKERQLLLLLQLLKLNKDYFTLLIVGKSGGRRMQDARLVADELIILTETSAYGGFSKFIQLIKIAKKRQPKIVHTWGSGIWDLLGVIAARWSQIPVIVNGIRSAPGQLNLSDQLTRFSAIISDAFIANSEAGLEAFHLQNHQNAHVIYNGLDIKRFDREMTNAVVNQALCMVANFRKEKDHKSLLLAMPAVISAFPDVKLILVGHDFGTLGEVRKHARNLGISDHITIITDSLKPAPIIAQSQICILSTYGEGISNVLLEYMALSKPVIASDIGGNPEVVINGFTGFLVTPQIPSEISQKVIHLLQNPLLSQEMGKAGREEVIKIFNIDHMRHSYLALYHQMIANN